MCYRNVPPLPGLTPNGRRVVMMRGVDLEQIAATVADGMKVVLMIGDIRLKEENIGVAGDVYILDASVATPQNFANHFAKFTPSLIKKFLICVQVRKSTIYSDRLELAAWPWNDILLLYSTFQFNIRYVNIIHYLPLKFGTKSVLFFKIEFLILTTYFQVFKMNCFKLKIVNSAHCDIELTAMVSFCYIT